MKQVSERGSPPVIGLGVYAEKSSPCPRHAAPIRAEMRHGSCPNEFLFYREYIPYMSTDEARSASCRGKEGASQIERTHSQPALQFACESALTPGRRTANIRTTAIVTQGCFRFITRRSWRMRTRCGSSGAPLSTLVTPRLWVCAPPPENQWLVSSVLPFLYCAFLARPRCHGTSPSL